MLSNLFIQQSRTSLYGYERVRLPFHAIRLCQLVSSIVVMSIMAFFIYHLNHDNWPVPWTFKVLMTVSVLTITLLTTSLYLHLTHGLNPRLNLAFNTSVFVIWTAGFGMLAWWMWGTLTHYCDLSYWSDGTGIMVCQVYKALFTFALLGVISTLLAVALDLHISRLNAQHMHFRLNNLNADRKHPLVVAGPYAEIDRQGFSTENLSSERENLRAESQGLREADERDAFQIPAMAFERDSDAKKHGYAVPEAQFDYETGYLGAHAERVFGATK